VHRAAQILEAVASLVRARLDASGSHSGVKVFTHRRFTLDPEQDELPAISVDYGEDRRADSSVLSAISSTLTVECTAVVVAPLEYDLRTKLLELRAEIHRAVMANHRLGLPDVVSTTFYGGASAPAIDADGEHLVGELTSTWLVLYEMSLSDPAN
jgi:hypothetical protein